MNLVLGGYSPPIADVESAAGNKSISSTTKVEVMKAVPIGMSSGVLFKLQRHTIGMSENIFTYMSRE